jgi:hypothetical protein
MAEFEQVVREFFAAQPDAGQSISITLDEKLYGVPFWHCRVVDKPPARSYNSA